jgi:hypothetical protein
MTKKTKKAGPISAADFAATDFEPMHPEDLKKCEPPNNAEWAEISVSHVPALRMAWLFMGMTKTKMVEGTTALGSEGICSMLDTLEKTIAFHIQALSILEKAHLRFAVAASVVVKQEGGFEKETPA